VTMTRLFGKSFIKLDSDEERAISKGSASSIFGLSSATLVLTLILEGYYLKCLDMIFSTPGLAT
jgi:hypothetical protein